MDPKTQADFERAAAGDNVFREMWLFLRHTKKWWLLPVFVALALFGLLCLLSGTGVAPFIYTIF